MRTLELGGSEVVSGDDRNIRTALSLEAMCAQLKRALSADHRHSVNSLAALLQDVKRSLHASAAMRRMFWKARCYSIRVAFIVKNGYCQAIEVLT